MGRAIADFRLGILDCGLRLVEPTPRRDLDGTSSAARRMGLSAFRRKADTMEILEILLILSDTKFISDETLRQGRA